MRAKKPIYLLERRPGEIDRLDVQHYAVRETVGASYLAPVVGPRRVLDVGCGTGQWAYEVCAQLPDTHVTGIDLEAVKPGQPANFQLVRANVLCGLPFTDGRFDLVHQQLMAASSVAPRAWSALIGELARVTRPGGWVELVEAHPVIERPGPACRQLWALAGRLVQAMGLDMSGFVPETLGRYLCGAGLVDVQSQEFLLPLGEWGGRVGSLMASDYRAIGARLSDAFEAHLGLPAAEHRELLRRAQCEWEECRSQVRVLFAWGRKPPPE